MVILMTSETTGGRDSLKSNPIVCRTCAELDFIKKNVSSVEIFLFFFSIYDLFVCARRFFFLFLFQSSLFIYVMHFLYITNSKKSVTFTGDYY